MDPKTTTYNDYNGNPTHIIDIDGPQDGPTFIGYADDGQMLYTHQGVTMTASELISE